MPVATWAQEDDEDYEEDYENDEGYGEEDEASESTEKAKDDKPPMFVGPYALVIACVGLGVWVLCRPSRREGPKETAWLPSGLLGSGDAEGEAKKKGPAARGKEVCPQAKTALNISIAGIVPVLGLLLGGLGLFKSIQAKKLIAENRRLTGDGLALAGIIVGAVMIVVQAVVTVVVVIKLAG